LIVEVTERHLNIHSRSNQHSKINNHQSEIKPLKVFSVGRATLEAGLEAFGQAGHVKVRNSANDHRPG
jgi:hypothetical protein